MLDSPVEQVSGADLLAEAGLSEVDIVIGGPSCQGFSTHGRRSGWVRDDDPRNFLYREFARIIGDLQPTWFVMENVPGLLYYERGEFGRRIFSAFESLGYSLSHKLLLAADYGIPQLRKRLIIVGTRTGQTFLWPEQTAWVPTGETQSNSGTVAEESASRI